jgi:hypothetical protein
MAPLSDAELKTQQRGVVLAAGLALIVCAATLAAAYVGLPRFFEFPLGLAERMAFAVQADVFVFLWVVFGVRQVADRRFRSAADNRGSAFGPPSRRLAIPVAFLQNTLEQAVMAAGAHLALATLVAGDGLSLIVGAVALFGIGRVCFLVGYPMGARGRAFGVVLTVIPTMAAYGLAVYLIGKAMIAQLLT